MSTIARLALEEFQNRIIIENWGIINASLVIKALLPVSMKWHGFS